MESTDLSEESPLLPTLSSRPPLPISISRRKAFALMLIIGLSLTAFIVNNSVRSGNKTLRSSDFHIEVTGADDDQKSSVDEYKDEYGPYAFLAAEENFPLYKGAM
jgi:hypothetical protein